MTGAFRTVSDATFVDVVLGCATSCLVEFHRSTDGNGPGPAWLADVARAHPWLTCARLDVATSPRAAQTYDVSTLPAYVLFRLGAVVSVAVGATDLPALLASVVDAPTVS